MSVNRYTNPAGYLPGSCDDEKYAGDLFDPRPADWKPRPITAEERREIAEFAQQVEAEHNPDNEFPDVSAPRGQGENT